VDFAAELIHNIPAIRIEACSHPRYWQSSFVTKDALHNYDMVRVNPPDWLNCLIVDVDRPQSVFDWENHDIPPNIVTENLLNGHTHHVWWLREPIWRGPQKGNGFDVRAFAGDIRHRLTAATGGDPSYAGIWMKNPCSTKWRTHILTRYLYELNDFIALPPLKHSGLVNSGTGRNNDTFVSLINYAYSIRLEMGSASRQDWQDRLEPELDAIARKIAQQYPQGALPESELHSILSSVVRYAIKGKLKKADTKKRGVMGLDEELPLRERQIRGSQYTAELKRAKSTETIAQARQENPTATQMMVARTSGLSLSTVQRNWV
jgi:hypothetical protein